jgi:hypothetical protein
MPLRRSQHYGADTITVASNNSHIFICTTAGTTAETEPAAYAAAVDGTQITDGTAVFTAYPLPAIPTRISSHPYAVNTIKVASNATRIFTCITAGTSATTEPVEYATAADNQLLIDGTAVFRAVTQHAVRANSQKYWEGDAVVVASNTRPFYCISPTGHSDTSAATEPPGYATAVDGTLVTDGGCVFQAGTPLTRADSYLTPPTISSWWRATARTFSIARKPELARQRSPWLCRRCGWRTDYRRHRGFRASTKYSIRANSQAYGADTIKVASNPSRVFTCTASRTSAGGACRICGCGRQRITDGGATFAPAGPIGPRQQSGLFADTIAVPSNPTRIFTCETTLGVTRRRSHRCVYGRCRRHAHHRWQRCLPRSAPLSSWITAQQPPIYPTIIEPTSTWDVGILPLETTTLFEIIDYDLLTTRLWSRGPTFQGHCSALLQQALCPRREQVFVKTYKTKIYSVGGSVLYFSAVGNPAD